MNGRYSWPSWSGVIGKCRSLSSFADRWYYYPDPRVQRKMEVLWLKSHGLNHDDIAAYADVSLRTVQRYLDGRRSNPNVASAARVL